MTSALLKKELRHLLDDLFLLSENDPRAVAVEQKIYQTRKQIRELKREEEEEHARNKIAIA